MRKIRAVNAAVIAGFVLTACTDAVSPRIEPSAARTGNVSVEAVELPPLPGGSGTIAGAINNRGQIAGASTSAASTYAHATRWTRNVPQDLGTLGARYSQAYGINARGDVVGSAEIPGNLGRSHAFFFTDEGGMQDLGTLGGTGSGAVAINDQRVIVGSSQTSAGAFHAFRWTPETGMQDIGTLPGWTSSAARDVNTRGDVVGSFSTASGTHAVLWTKAGAVIDLGTLPGGDYSEASAISERGEIAGTSRTSSGEFHPVRWTNRHEIVDLGVLQGDIGGGAVAINASGAVVGGSSGEDPFGGRAFIWSSQSGMQELPGVPGATLSIVYDVNDAGVAVGESGVFPETRAVRWVRRAGVSETGP